MRKLTKKILKAQQRLRRAVNDDAWKEYSNALLRLSGSFPKGLLVNFEVVREHGSIASLMPEQGMHDAMIFLAGPEVETGDAVEPFITFGLDEDDDESDPRLAN